MNECIVDYLSLNTSLIIRLKDGYNLMENNDVFLRASIALGTGCDALPGGIKSIGVAFIKKQKELSWVDLLLLYAEKSKIKIEVLKTYVSSIVYKPGDTIQNIDINNRSSTTPLPPPPPLSFSFLPNRGN